MKTFILLHLALVFTIPAIICGADKPLFTQSLDWGTVSISTLSTNVSFRAHMVSAEELERTRLQNSSAGGLEPMIPVTIKAELAYVMRFSSSVFQPEPLLWMGLQMRAIPDKGYESRLSKDQRFLLPVIFHSAFYEPTNKVAALHWRAGNGSNVLWFADSWVRGEEAPWEFGFSLNLPETRTALASHIRYIPDKKQLILQIQYPDGEEKRYRVDLKKRPLFEITPDK